MEWTSLADLREKFLSFFESKDHLRLKSFPLIPQGDKSLLLINSGMAPMKKYFTGEVTPPKNRITTCQKCIRTPDIEQVGITDRHGTFFEMLGNFSFGDYFKEEICPWAWEFCTEVLRLPEEKLYVTIYQDDDEAYSIWKEQVGIAKNHIVRLGKEDNFWEHGIGPCGPCSEIYFDRGKEHGCGKDDCMVGCDCDRYIEFWNLVFTGLYNDGKGNYTKLHSPNIDTGMGLERLACIMQNVDNLFLVDSVQNIIKEIENATTVKYGTNSKSDISLRVITDHIRSSTFMLGDGVMPSNEGRGYVLRRLLRRAARHAKLLGVNDTFLSRISETCIKENKDAYPELDEKSATILKIISGEEENFHRTIDQGMSVLNAFIDNAEKKILSGEEAFKLSDTYGFPIDLTREILLERGMGVDEEGFLELLEQQKKTARDSRKQSDKEAFGSDSSLLQGVSSTFFTGYNQLEQDADIVAIIKDGKRVDSATVDENVLVILNTTCFYAESGGQVGDTGVIENSKCSLEVYDTTKFEDIVIHHCVIKSGVVSVNDKVEALVDAELRHDIERNHTAAHLLQAALQHVLGSHVQQAGQLVSPDSVRFDFTHFEALTPEELAKVEKRVNKIILKAVPCVTKELPIDEAKKLGAMALFGEKYKDIVRVMLVDEYSKEFCGGCHVKNTSHIGIFKIISEQSVASGVRRIEAYTGRGVMRLLQQVTGLIEGVASALKITNKQELLQKALSLTNDLRAKDRELETLRSKLAMLESENIFNKSIDINGFSIVRAIIPNVTVDELRRFSDIAKQKKEAIISVFIGTQGDKATILVSCSKLAVEKGADAGKIVKQVASICDGSGGGKKDSAMAGARDLSKLDVAILAVEGFIAELNRA